MSAALAVAALALAGCTAPEPTPTPPPSPSPSYVSHYETPAPVVYAPLTGLPVADPAGLAHPSLAAKIDNLDVARPQYGLEATDLVFEELVEGGLTRYVAVWHSNVPAEIGPVRSIRPMDPDIISPLGGIVAYSGGKQRFVQLMRSTNVYNAVHGYANTADLMYRTSEKTAPHNVVLKASKIVKRHDDIAPPPQQYSYADTAAGATAALDGTPIAGVDLVFGVPSKPSWRWDADAERWVRFQSGGARDVDSNGDQLSAVNVVIVRVGVSSDGGIPKTELIGSGEAWALAGGAIVHARWSKGSRTAPIRLVDDTGAVIRLAPGNSWIELVPKSGSVTTVAAD